MSCNKKKIMYIYIYREIKRFIYKHINIRSYRCEKLLNIVQDMTDIHDIYSNKCIFRQIN